MQMKALFARLIGGVLSLSGLAIIAVFLRVIWALIDARRALESSGLLILGGLLTVGLFCTLVGFRLVLNRPNRYGSILSPNGWAVLGFLFALSALLILVLALMQDRPEFVAQAPLGAVFSAACFLNRRRVARLKNGAL